MNQTSKGLVSKIICLERVENYYEQCPSMNSFQCTISS